MEFSRKNILTQLSNYKKLPIVSRLAPSSIRTATSVDLDNFEEAQRVAYDCAIQAAYHLEVGMSEKEIASWMADYLTHQGVRGGFHRPLAWFGDRTRFKGMRSESDAFPTDRKLADKTEPVIIDVAPILDGYVADIGFAFSLEPNAELIQAREFLLELRKLLPELFATSMKVSEIWQVVDEKIKERGYQNCHKKYIMSVLGHRVYRIPFEWPMNYMGMYSTRAYVALTSRGFFPELLSPYHKGAKTGVWALEPHIGSRDHQFGAKFEEILVVEEVKAYWLTDDVPHLNLPEGLY